MEPGGRINLQRMFIKLCICHYLNIRVGIRVVADTLAHIGRMEHKLTQ